MNKNKCMKDLTEEERRQVIERYKKDPFYAFMLLSGNKLPRLHRFFRKLKFK